MIFSPEVTVSLLSPRTLHALDDAFGGSTLNDEADSFDLDASLPPLVRVKSPLSPDFDPDLDDLTNPDSDGDALDSSPFDSDEEGDALDKNPISLEELQAEEEKEFGQGDDPYSEEE